MKKTCAIAILVWLFSLSALAATITVTATGTCPTDRSAIALAVSGASPGDVIELLPGSPPKEFDFTCVAPGDEIGVFVSTFGITITGVPGETIIRGPGFATVFGSTGFVVRGDGVTVRDLVFRDFFRAILIAPRGAVPPRDISVSHILFEHNIRAVVVRADTDHVSLTHNTVVIPVPPDSDIFGTYGITSGFLIGSHCDDLLVAENTFVGPGAVARFQSLEDLLASSTLPGLGIRTLGVLQGEALLPVATLGRFSGNSFSGLDAGFQASSDVGVITRNTLTQCALGMIVSNDVGDGVTAVRDNIVALNSATNGQVGLAMASASGNVVTLNDFSTNSFVGMIFLANLANGAVSEDNVFLRNQGSVRNVAGNQGLALRELLP